jgi:hypothetical protein
MTDFSKIERDVSLVVSTGRTATRFFGETLGQVVEDAVSFHEPDMLTLRRKGRLKTIGRFGLYQTVLGKLIDTAGIRAVGHKYLAGKRTARQTAQALIAHRKRFFEKQPQSLIIESYNQWFSVLDILPLVFRNYRVGVIIRDPRSWLASSEKWALWWHSRDLVYRLGLLRLNPELLRDTATSAVWKQMSAFERMAWSWNTINKRLERSARTDPWIEMFRFEDLFEGDRNEEQLERFLKFVTEFGERRYRYSIRHLLENPKVHASSGDSSQEWRRWSREKCRSVEKYCGDLMREWGYGSEPEWLECVSAESVAAP